MTIADDDTEPELTEVERQYNIANSTLFGDAAFGHYKHVTAGLDGDRAYRHLLRTEMERFEAAVLLRAAEWFDRYDTDSAAQLRRMAAEANPA